MDAPGRSDEVLCVGEVLWDALPAGLFLGGAPFNVACHLRAAGVSAALVSRIGADRLGDEALRRAKQYGVDVGLVQVDRQLPTGFVRVALSDAGEPAYDIVAPAAWDAIAPDPELLRRAGVARAIVFGTLAQRNAGSRSTIERLWETRALRVLDVNLRPPYDDREVVRRSLAAANVVKMTAEELRQIAGWFELPGRSRRRHATRHCVEALAAAFDCAIVCVTHAEAGAELWHDGRWTAQPGFEVDVRDTVGAGDALLAVLLAGLLAGGDDRSVLRHATLMGAYVTTQYGALPLDQARVVGRDPPAAPDRTSRPY